MAQKVIPTLASSENIEATLGQQIEIARLARNLTQTEVARSAGISRRTITRLENGGGVSLDTFIRVLRALGLADRLANLLPDPQIQPIERIRGKQKRRQRARPTSSAATKGAASQWAWHDEADTS